MTWIVPMLRSPRYRQGGRPVVVDGVFYASLTEARRSTGLSYTRLYYRLGERWRFPTGRKL